MADNVTYTAGANATPPNATLAATDELSDGSHAGIAKIAISADGSRVLIPATAADGLLVNLGTNNDVTVTGTVSVTEPVSVDDNGGSLTVDAPVGTPVNVQVGDGALTATVRNTGAADSLNVAIVDAAGNQITSFGGSGGTAETDGDAFVADTTAGTPAMGAFETVPSTLSDGEVGIVGVTANRQLKVLEENSAGIEALLTTIDGDTGTLAGAVTGTEMQVDVVAALPAGNNNIGDVDIASLPNEGQQTMANSISVAVASDQSAIPISDGGGVITVDGTVTANAGTNLNTSLLALEAGGNLAAVAASASVLDDWDETNRAAVNIIAGQVGVAGGSGVDSALTQRVSLATNVALPAGTNNIGDVDVLTLPAIPAGNNNIGDVDIASFPATALEVVGDVAADVGVPANPVSVGGRASDALPSEVSGDGDSVYQWLLRNGAAMTAQLPHLGLMGDPYAITSVTAQYTTAQTSTVLINPGASQRIAVTYIQIQVGGTVGGTLQVYFGTGAYSRGTSLAIFDGEFLPSATLKPGFTASPAKPFISAAADDDLRVTNTGTINPLTVTVWYYLIG